MTDKKTSKRVLTPAEHQRMQELVAQLPALFPTIVTTFVMPYIEHDKDPQEGEKIIGKCSDVAIKAMSSALSEPAPRTEGLVIERLIQSIHDVSANLMTPAISPKETEIYAAFVRFYDTQCDEALLRITRGLEQFVAPPRGGRFH